MPHEKQVPMVSIIIPTFNQSEYLIYSLESALAQSYRNFEIIVVDDGSTDDTASIICKYGNRIRYIHQENQGLAGARNTGINHAQGCFIALLDSDDIWLPTFIEEMMSLAENEPNGTVYYCGWRYIDSSGQILPQAPHSWVIQSSKMYDTLLRVNFIIPSTVLMKRIPVIEAGMFDPSFRRLQDWELWLRLLKSGFVFIGSRKCLVHYRVHGNALTADIAGGQKAALAMIKKNFGDDDGLWNDWPMDKQRAYGGVYRYIALLLIQHQNDWQSGAQYLSKAFRVDKSLVEDVDLFYDLALSSQPAGFRGTLEFQDFQKNALRIEELIVQVLVTLRVSPRTKTYKQIFGTAFYALGLLAYNLDQKSVSRGYLIKSFYYRPELFRNSHIIGIFMRSFISKRSIARLKRIISSVGIL